MWGRTRSDLNRTPLYLLNRPGPTVFTIRNERNNQFRVTLGSPHTCTCRSGLCVHIFYVLVKVIGVPEDSPYCRKTHLSDYEIDQILNTNFGNSRRRRPVVTPRQAPKKVQRGTEGETNALVERQRFDGSVEMCPICQVCSANKANATNRKP